MGKVKQMCGILGEYLWEHVGELEKHVRNIVKNIEI
jgi:hypothetical protein